MYSAIFLYLKMRILIAICLCSLIIIACSVSVDKEELTGTWDYIKVENLSSSSQDSTSTAELKAAQPYIRFSEQNKLQIFWAGKLLSTGIYHIDGAMIRYKEDLPDGVKREFPFLVKKLSDNELIFETMSREGTRVTAVRRN